VLLLILTRGWGNTTESGLEWQILVVKVIGKRCHNLRTSSLNQGRMYQ